MCQNKARGSPSGSMNSIKKRLTRTLSGPRRCIKCQKMIYFSVYRCKQCGEITHKHCFFHTSQSCKENSVDNSDVFPLPILKTKEEDAWRSPGSEAWLRTDYRPPDPASPGAAMAGLLKIVQWLSHRKQAAPPRTTEKHIRGKFGLNLNVEDKHTKKKLKTLIKNYQKQMYAASRCPPAYSVPPTCGYRPSRLPSKRPPDPFSPRSSVSSHSSSFMSPDSTPDTSRSRRDKLLKQASIKWERDVAKSSLIANHLAVAKPSSELHFGDRPRHPSVSPKPSLRHNDWSKGLFGRDPKTATISFGRPPCLTKAKTLSIESRECQNESLCATWPPAGKAGTILEEIVDEGETDCIEEADESFNLSDFRSDSQSGEESLKEWYIPFGDLEFQERIRNGRRGDIYKGKWYGEVLIYTIHGSCSEELNHFLDEVAQMGMIRHENIVLFMGACIEPQRLAVITSMRKGPTLFEYLHLKRHKLPFHSKHNIARQISQGMGYLHAKGIVHKNLNSKNIILECRVKVCIMDHGMSDKQLDRSDYGCIPRGHLSYLSPELMCSLQINPPLISTTQPCTQESDIYAFGSLLYELLAERFTFHDQPPHAIIWQVSTGKTAPLHNFRFINGLKTLIKRCWYLNTDQRPPFSEILHILQENVSHHRRHSCSEPDLLHHTGQTSGRGLCT